MRSLLITAAAAAAASVLSGCPDQTPEPVPGPKSALAQHATADIGEHDNSALRGCPAHRRGVSEISWFQGTLEEAFSRRSSSDNKALLRF